MLSFDTKRTAYKCAHSLPAACAFAGECHHDHTVASSLALLFGTQSACHSITNNETGIGLADQAHMYGSMWAVFRISN